MTRMTRPAARARAGAGCRGGWPRWQRSWPGCGPPRTSSPGGRPPRVLRPPGSPLPRRRWRAPRGGWRRPRPPRTPRWTPTPPRWLPGRPGGTARSRSRRRGRRGWRGSARTWPPRRPGWTRPGRPPPASPVKVSATDPDSRLLPAKNGGGWLQGWNLQLTAARRQVLLAAELHDNPADAGALAAVITAAIANCELAGLAGRIRGLARRQRVRLRRQLRRTGPPDAPGRGPR